MLLYFAQPACLPLLSISNVSYYSQNVSYLVLITNQIHLFGAPHTKGTV
jgi:hypothetical protein